MATQHLLNFTNAEHSYDIEFEIQLVVNNLSDWLKWQHSDVQAKVTRVWVDGTLSSDLNDIEYCSKLINDWLHSENEVMV